MAAQDSTLELAALPAVRLPAEAWSSRMLTGLGGALDGLALEAARLAVDTFLMPRPEELPRMLETAAPFLTGELRQFPRRFLTWRDDVVVVGEQHEIRRRSVRGGAIVSRRLLVPYTTYAGEPVDVTHDAVRVEHWMHGGSWQRPTVLGLHGFGMGYPRFDAVALFASELYQRGFDVALMTLPYHGRRTPPQARFSGQHFTAVDVAQLNEAMRRAVFEIVAVERWLRARRGAPVGLLGLSLGGYLAALAAALLPQLDFVIPVVPPVCIGDLAWRFFSRSRHYAGAGRQPFPRDELRTAYRPHSPLTYPAVVARERLLILAGRGDQIVPPEHPHALWRHWAEPGIHWFSGSHLAPFRRRTLVSAIAAHIEACCR